MDGGDRRARVLALVDLLEAFALDQEDPRVEANRFAAVEELRVAGAALDALGAELLGVAVLVVRRWAEDTGRPVDELCRRLREFLRAEEPTE